MGHFMLKILSLFPRNSLFKTKNSTLFSDIPGNILFLKEKQYYSSINAAIYGAGQVQDPRHRHLTSYTNCSVSSSEQKEKEEEYNANENLSFMSVE